MSRTIVFCVASALLILPVLLGCRQDQAQLGTEEHPFIWMLSTDNELEQLHTSAEEVSATVYELTGLHLRVLQATEEEEVLAALSSRPATAHIVTLSAAAYLGAWDQGTVVPAFLGSLEGSTHYHGLLLTHRGTGISRLADLADRPGGRMATSNSDALSGRVIPLLHLFQALPEQDENGVEIIEFSNDTEVLTALYRRQAEVGAVQSDLRAALSAEEEFEGIAEQLVLLGPTIEIPNRGLQFSTLVSAEARRQVMNALLQISNHPHKVAVLNGLYGWEYLVEKQDDVYEPLRELMRDAGVESLALP